MLMESKEKGEKEIIGLTHLGPLLWQVNGKTLHQPEDGVHLTVIDGHDGKVVDTKGFRNSILQGIPAEIDNYISGLRDK